MLFEIGKKLRILPPMMKPLKAHCLKRGDVIGVCAPASAPADGEQLDRGIRYLEKLGFRVEPGKHLHKQRGYLAGTDAERADDLHRLFANRHVRAIIAARGGYGTMRLLPLLRYPLLRKHPKIFVGYSDVTALHLAFFRKAGLVTFSGPMVASDFGRGFSGKAEEIFWRMMMSPEVPPPLVAGPDALRLRSVERKTRGRIFGGNLSLVGAMLGTRFLPREESTLLFLEEIDERPYRIDRMLQQIRLTGLMDRTTGILLGQFTACAPSKNRPSLTLRHVLHEAFQQIPTVSGFHLGHVRNPLTIAFGVRAEIDPRRKKLTYLESPLRA